MAKSTHNNVNIQNKTELSDDQVQTVIKEKKRGSHWMQELTAEGGDNIEPGENSRFIRHALASWNLPKIDISDPKQVEERIGEYFKYCAENDRRPQVVGMCNWLGISRQALNEWKNGDVRSGTHGDIIKKAFDLMEELWMDFMQSGKINPATGIFLAKNWYHYKDVADVVVTPNNPYDQTTEQERTKKYLDGMVDDTDE